MGEHVHDEIGPGQDHLSRWGEDRMRRHLRDAHGVSVPMSWDLGHLHLAHLNDHQEAEEVPVPRHNHGDIARWHEMRPRIQVIRHLMEVHGLTPDEMSDEVYGQHARLHLMQTTAEEAPMTQTPPRFVARPADADDGPRKLYLSEFPGGNWDEAQQETRDYWRHQYAARTLRNVATTGPLHLPRQHTPLSESGERHAEHRIMVDRITAVMAGLDFDREWAADDGIGPNVRGALRTTFQRAAEQTLAWLERGGLASVPGYLDLLDERIREERDEALRQAALEREAGAEARRQMGEQQRSMQEMAQIQSDLENQLRLLTEERDRLDQQMTIDQREHGRSLDAVQRQLEAAIAEQERLRGQFQSVVAERDRVRDARVEVEHERDEARAAFDRMNAQRVATEQELSTQLSLLSGDLEAITAERDEAIDVRDRAQQALMAKLTEADTLREERDSLARKLQARTQALNEGRSKLRALVSELRDTYWEESSVYQRLVEILGEPVSTVTEASQAPVESVSVDGPLQSGTKVTVTIGGRVIDAGGRIESVKEADQLEALSEGYLLDDIAWARRFAQGGEA